VITPVAAMNTHLVDDTNIGGFVFENQDSDPITVTKMTLDLSYTALNTQAGPLVLRFLDPTTGKFLYDFDMLSLPALPSPEHTYGEMNIDLPIAFTFPASAKKLLQVEVLGVHKMLIVGNDPMIKIALRGVTTDSADVRTLFLGAEIHWSCIVTNIPFDPNATTGPFATGEACKD
jgi:hypothetical protein